MTFYFVMQHLPATLSSMSLIEAESLSSTVGTSTVCDYQCCCAPRLKRFALGWQRPMVPLFFSTSNARVPFARERPYSTSCPRGWRYLSPRVLSLLALTLTCMCMLMLGEFTSFWPSGVQVLLSTIATQRRHLCIFGPKGAVKIRYYYYYYRRRWWSTHCICPAHISCMCRSAYYQLRHGDQLFICCWLTLAKWLSRRLCHHAWTIATLSCMASPMTWCNGLRQSRMPPHEWSPVLRGVTTSLQFCFIGLQSANELSLS